ncbi:MAG TPA: glycosyltransferase family 4 protein [Candidatus Methylomirabilis sp.]|nr:glycosyltransferase family 4 protein [Candidatus Methylomirabilis sp.]
MNILVLAESLDPSSGWGAYARSLVGALRTSGTTVTVLTSDNTSESLPCLPLSEAKGACRGGIRLPRFHAGGFAWSYAGFRLRRWLAGRTFDAVHVMVEPYARLYRAFGNVPFVITVHGTYADPAAHGRYASTFRHALERACRIVAVSEYTRERVQPEFQEKTVAIPNGVDLGIVDEPFDPAPAHGTPLVLSVGAMKARKGFDRLIAGFAEFVRSHPNAELVIIGRDDDPSLRQRLAAQAERFGIASRVRMLGEVSRPALLGWYRACDVFALTPVTDGGFEGFGLVFLEANAFGKPCVGSRDSGARDAIIDGVTGVLVDATSSTDVARGLGRALTLTRERIQSETTLVTWGMRAKEYQSAYRTCQPVA